MTFESKSVLRRLRALKKLVEEYFRLEKGALIEKHAELLRVFDVRGSKHKDHPHKRMRVYITRRALKHVVESRKEQMLIRHTEEEALEAVCFALDHMPETIIHFDKFEYEPPTYCYQKDFAPEGKPMLRIALELRAGRLEIKSIHFKKRK